MVKLVIFCIVPPKFCKVFSVYSTPTGPDLGGGVMTAQRLGAALAEQFSGMGRPAAVGGDIEFQSARTATV